MALMSGPLSFVLYALLYLLVLAVVVVVHELGHFWVGRWCGVKVDAFSFGFGPELLSWTDRHGTRWRWAVVPLGGYVKFAGDANAASVADGEAIEAMSEAERSVTLQGKSVAQRAAIVAAGPIANFLLSILVLTALYLAVGKDESILPPTVGGFSEKSAAADAGMKIGDRIVSIDGVTVETFMDLPLQVMNRAGDQLHLVVKRGDERLEFDIVPRLDQTETSLGVRRRGLLGIQPVQQPETIRHIDLGLGGAVVQAVETNWMIVTQTLGFFKRLFTGHEYIDQLSGVARMAHVVADAAQFGLAEVLARLAFISTSIGLLNLFPIPILDGGHLVFYAFEAIRGRPLPERVQEFGFRVGLTLVLALMIIANGNDLIHYGGRFLSNWVR